MSSPYSSQAILNIVVEIVQCFDLHGIFTPQNTTAYLDDDAGDDQRAKTFSSLHWGREYCVSVKVAGRGSLSISNVSSKQCVRLPERGTKKLE